MKLSCLQENLTKSLNVVSHITGKNITLPILNNVLLRAEKGVLKLETTNLELGIITVVRGKIEKEGAFTVQAKTINEFVNFLPNEKIDMELVAQDLKIKCKNTKTTIRGMDASEFPMIPRVEEKDPYIVKSSDFRTALSQTVFSVALDESRPEISGIFLSFGDKKLTIAATDSYRLAEKGMAFEKGSSKSKKVILPLRAAQELIRIIDESSEVSIYINENQVLFSTGQTSLVSRQIEGQYPDYKQIIPNEYKTKIILNKKEFEQAVKRVSLFCKPSINDITLQISSQNQTIMVSAANAQVGESETDVEAKVEGEENKIVFNYRYLLEGLQSMDADEVAIEIASSQAAALMKPKEKKDYLYLIMPIKQ